MANASYGPSLVLYEAATGRVHQFGNWIAVEN